MLIATKAILCLPFFIKTSASFAYGKVISHLPGVTLNNMGPRQEICVDRVRLRFKHVFGPFAHKRVVLWGS